VALPSTPAALMRARYTAFELHMGPYLIETWHVSTRPAVVDVDDGTVWLGLQVEGSSGGDATDPDRAEVVFTARFRVGGRTGKLSERSLFIRENGRWFYVGPREG
jgi:SEC-C motif-containing protein